MISRRHKYSSAAIFALMIMAVLIKSAVPAGFMPSFDNGMTKMVICSGLGEKTIFIPSEDSNDDHGEKSNDVCSYQVLISQQIIPAPSIEFLPKFDFQTISYEWSVAAALTIRGILALNARGPPIA